ncbi:MAG TPA: ATP-binding protein [Phenylobacterium sp.]
MGKKAEAPDQRDWEAAAWFFENTVDIFLVVNDGAIERSNPAWTELTGWTAEECLGRRYSDFIHAEDAQAIHRMGRVMHADQPATQDLRLLSKSGGWIWVRARAKRAVDGRALIVLQDISAERARNEVAIHARRTAKLLGQAAGVSIWRYDAVAEIYDMHPLTPDPIGDSSRIGVVDFRKSVHRDDIPAMDKAWDLSRRTGEIGTVEYRRKGEDGWRRFRSTWQGIVQRPSGDWDVLVITQDITELADARDAALTAAEAKATFLANISHEIRTPMNGVLGVLHILKTEAMASENHSLVEEALACGATLSQLLDDIIDFSKVESGKVEFSPEPVELSDALDVVAGMLRPEAESRGLYLLSETPEGAGWAMLDPIRLRQMLFNLLGNAVKFTLRGGVRMRLTTRGAGDRQRVRIEVEDTGIGIAPEGQVSLFERFQQADGSTTRRFGGSGLGLAVTKALTEQMGGRIGFKSKEGRGSTFWIDIPAPACEAPLAMPEAGERWLEGLRVLVVEDNATNRLVATRMLGALGAEVDTAEDGAQGVDRATETAYDLIFMDIQMPVMDGIEATRRIRALPGAAGHTPIVATTANVMAHQIEAYRQVGMDGHVAKPISPAALLGEIARLSGDVEEAA